MVGIFHMASAHNQMDRVGGYAPAQWAYGRLPSLDNRLFEGGNEIFSFIPQKERWEQISVPIYKFEPAQRNSIGDRKQP